MFRDGDNKERWHILENDIVKDYDDDEEVYLNKDNDIVVLESESAKMMYTLVI